MTSLDRHIRFHIYRSFAATGHAPSSGELAAAVGASVGETDASLERLAAAHSIALEPGSTRIWMAHPFSAVPTSFVVETAERTYWANCAWDALGIPALLGVDAHTHARCAQSREPITLRVHGGVAGPADAVIHFLVPPRRFWDDVGFT